MISRHVVARSKENQGNYTTLWIVGMSIIRSACNCQYPFVLFVGMPNLDMRKKRFKNQSNLLYIYIISLKLLNVLPRSLYLPKVVI